MENKFYYYFVLATTGDYDNYNVNYAHAENFLCLTTKKINFKKEYWVLEKEIYGYEIHTDPRDTCYTVYDLKSLTKDDFEMMSKHFRVVVNELGQ